MSESHSVVSDSLLPHRLYSPWNSLGQNTGVDSLALLQGILPTQGSDPGIEPRSPTLQADALTSAPPGAPPLEAALKQGSCSSAGKNPPAMRETSVRFLGQEDPLEKG